MWDIKSSLTTLEPVDVVIDYFYEYRSILSDISNLAHNIPDYLENRKIREELVCELRGKSDILDIIKISKDRYFDERIFQIYCYFSNAYINALYENQSNRIPFEIITPLIKISKKLVRKPFLSYHSYCLYNWKNNCIIQSFTKEKQENDFISSLITNQSKFDIIIDNIYKNTSIINYKYCFILLLEIYNFLENISILDPSYKMKQLMKPYSISIDDLLIVNCDKFYFLIILELLFFDNNEIDKYNIPFSHHKFLLKVLDIRTNFNNYLKNETKYRFCKDKIQELVLKFAW